MGSFTLISFLALFAVVQAAKYSGSFDNVNLDEILSNRRLLHGYLDCVLEKKHCTREGREIRAHIKEALEEDCAKCTDAQRNSGRRALTYIINNEPKYWDRLVAKYDPTHKYLSKWEAEYKAVKNVQ